MGIAPADTARQNRRLILAAVAAVVCALAMPPIGLALGIATLVVVAMRRRRQAALSRAATTLAMTSGVFAVLVGGFLSAVLVLFGSQTAALRECLAGANTRVAEQVCQDEFTDAVRTRIFG